VNAISFALAQVLIAGINLFLLATVVNSLLGWPEWAALIVAAAIVLRACFRPSAGSCCSARSAA
jgi:SSS family solute:Na+ symporter